MRHILILLSIILLSSPVIGQETGVLYQYETSTGIKWETFGDEKVQPKYEGEVSNGKPNGFGVLTYPYDEKSVVGEWKNGKYDGQGTYTWSDGRKYVGEWKDGETKRSWYCHSTLLEVCKRMEGE